VPTYLIQRGSYLPCPFFSSCERTDAANFFESVIVGFFSPLSTFEAKVDSWLDDCFLGMDFSPSLIVDLGMTRIHGSGGFRPRPVAFSLKRRLATWGYS